MRVQKDARIKATQMLQKSQEWVQTENKRLQQEEQQLQHVERKNQERRNWWEWIFGIVRRSTNTTAFFFIWGAVCFGWGGVALMATPKIVVCNNRSSPCYYFRLWQAKYTDADLKRWQCSKTQKGLLCLLPSKVSKKALTHK